jgi:hypothetical protein
MSRKQKLKDAEDIRLEIVKYLKDHGWSVALIADHGVKDLGDHKYEYYMKFLGSKKE